MIMVVKEYLKLMSYITLIQVNYIFQASRGNRVKISMKTITFQTTKRKKATGYLLVNIDGNSMYPKNPKKTKLFNKNIKLRKPIQMVSMKNQIRMVYASKDKKNKGFIITYSIVKGNKKISNSGIEKYPDSVLSDGIIEYFH